MKKIKAFVSEITPTDVVLSTAMVMYITFLFYSLSKLF